MALWKGTTEMSQGAFGGSARASEQGRLGDEDLPTWTKKTLAMIRKQVSEDHEG